MFQEAPVQTDVEMRRVCYTELLRSASGCDCDALRDSEMHCGLLDRL